MMNQRTPWGEIQQTEQIADGVRYVSTASHGGLVLDAERWMSLPEDVRKIFYHSPFAEEDCEAVLVLALLELEPERKHLEQAIRLAERFESYAPVLPHLREIQGRETRAREPAQQENEERIELGYDIRYTLTCPEEGPDVEAVAEMMAIIAENNHPGEPGYENATQCWTDVLRGSQFITWYDCQQHMEQVSSEHPGKLFQLELAGENADFDDLWTFYFRDGMVQEARGHVTYPEFDPGLLQPVRQKELDITTNPINEANMALEEAECNRRTGQAA